MFYDFLTPLINFFVLITKIYLRLCHICGCFLGEEERMMITRLQNLAFKCYQNKLVFISKAIYHYMRFAYSCDISFTAKIDPTVVFAHNGLGVVIGYDAVIGKGSKILHNVTIGGRSDRKNELGRSNPFIGEHVLVGAGACLLGPIEIADYVSIGANAVVIENVTESYSVVVGIPGKIIKTKSN